MHLFAWGPYASKHGRMGMGNPLHRFQGTRFDAMAMSSCARRDTRLARGRPRRSNRSRMTRPARHSNSSFEIPAANDLCPELGGQNGTVTSASSPVSPLSQECNPNSATASASTPHRPTFPNNFNRFRMGRINWGVWICLVVLSGLLIPAHIYLKQYAYRGELMGVFFVITLFFLVCFSVSMFHTKTRAILLHRLHLEEDVCDCNENNTPVTRTCPVHRQTSFVISEHLTSDSSSISNYQRGNHHRMNLTLQPHSRMVQSPQSTPGHNSSVYGSASEASRVSGAEEEPPPYDVAILLPAPPGPPTPRRSCETPPPPYELCK